MGYYRELKDVENARQVARLGLHAGSRLLDVGCNIGEFLLRARETYGVEGVGLDLSLGALVRARKVLSRVNRGDAEALPFAAGTFDVVTSFDVIEHVPHPDRLLAEIARVLKPGGRCLVYAISRQNQYTWHAFLRLATLGRMGQDVAGGHHPDRFLLPADVRRWAAESGLRELQLVPFHAFFTLAFDEFGARGVSFLYKRLLRRGIGPRPEHFPDLLVRAAGRLFGGLHVLLSLADLPWTAATRSNGFYFLGEKGV
ncbi:MAG: methyltransferase domain-containing protein [Candidatus Riflebacteria bacterium]|nr:methyltransferase domain-containing protein [Candidatus Riflebacteria bacterium]